MITINQIITIIDREVENYAEQFGCLELRRISGQPCFTCELNKIPTLIYPSPIVDGKGMDNHQLDNLKEQYRNTHKIIRLDIEIENIVDVLSSAVIVSDLVSKNFKYK
jgi:hypothetical protein